tara:strand:- start:32 stop:670 length:639 start_codon:yes stop_codon:yes gene_type:complete
MLNYELQKVFTKIYENFVWGDASRISGQGSFDNSIVNPYVDSISIFLKSFNKKLKIVDLGCGDFNVGSKIVKYSSEYIACDIVEFIIEENKKKYSDLDVNFSVLDISSDKLPKGDVAIIRQVLQHLCNEDISNIVKKLYGTYQYVIVTEHIPDKIFVPNKNILSGNGTRMRINSGVILTEKPFFLRIKDQKVISSIPLGNTDVLKTIVYQLY